MKFLHELGAYGMVGGFLVQLLLLGLPTSTVGDRFALIGQVSLRIVAPALGLVILSGLLAMVVRKVFFTKGWVWLKILLTLPTAYSVLATLPGLDLLVPSRLGAQLWVSIAMAAAITALSVWRPKSILPGM